MTGIWTDRRSDYYHTVKLHLNKNMDVKLYCIKDDFDAELSATAILFLFSTSERRKSLDKKLSFMQINSIFFELSLNC